MLAELMLLCRHGRVRRRVADLEIPVPAWRAGMRAFARQHGMAIRTGVVELLELSDPVTRRVRTVPVVYAVRIDIPDRAGTPWRPSRWERPPADAVIVAVRGELDPRTVADEPRKGDAHTGRVRGSRRC